jgi:hypothetical protein
MTIAEDRYRTNSSVLYGIDDFVVGERTRTPSVVWYKYNGKKWEKHVIDDTRLKPEAGGVCFDVDGFGRSFVPDAARFTVHVLDGAGNHLLRFGGEHSRRVDAADAHPCHCDRLQKKTANPAFHSSISWLSSVL